MRISVPTIPVKLASSTLNERVQMTPMLAIDRISEFLLPGNVALLTGAGVSVDSGIRAYRGPDGRYLNPNYRPIMYHELMDESSKGFTYRQRYWMRSYFGYPPVRDAQSNTTHTALASLQYASPSLISHLITQNVDGLHHKALSPFWPPSTMQDNILELHGTLFHVKCNRGHRIGRDIFQEWLSKANPRWAEFFEETLRAGSQPRTNPDGDVALGGVSYDDFRVPDCPACLSQNHTNSVFKPEVIFFGESIPPAVKARISTIESADRLLIIGSTLATYSAFRLLKRALELDKPVLLLNVGPTRADDLTKVEKIEIASGDVLPDVARNILGQKSLKDDAIKQLLGSGIRQPPPDEDSDRSPRAAG